MSGRRLSTRGWQRKAEELEWNAGQAYLADDREACRELLELSRGARDIAARRGTGEQDDHGERETT